MKVLSLIFLLTTVSLCAMERSPLINQNDLENKTEQFRHISTSMKLLKGTIAIPMIFGLLLMIWGAIDGHDQITPFGEIIFGAGLGCYVGACFSIPPAIKLDQDTKKLRRAPIS
jgi:hypothetical protein